MVGLGVGLGLGALTNAAKHCINSIIFVGLNCSGGETVQTQRDLTSIRRQVRKFLARAVGFDIVCCAEFLVCLYSVIL